MTQGQIVRLGERQRAEIGFRLDGEAARACEGDTVLTAILTLRPWLRMSEFGDGPRAGFCLMGACQDCWVEIDGVPARACSVLVAEGMMISTSRGRAGER